MKNYARGFAQLVLWLNGLLHVFYGVVFIANPQPLMRELSIAVLNADGLIEMRTFHGGLLFALGLVFVLAGSLKKHLWGGLWVMLITYAGAVLARSFGIILAASDNSFTWNILLVESIGFVTAAMALFWYSWSRDHEQ